MLLICYQEKDEFMPFQENDSEANETDNLPSIRLVQK